MNKRRLLRLAEILDTVQPEVFDLDVWRREDPKCGTVCCAFGWACMDKGFQDEGLRFDGMPIFNGRGGTGAAVDFFDISWCQAEYLFRPGAYWMVKEPGSATVAARIREMVAAA